MSIISTRCRRFLAGLAAIVAVPGLAIGQSEPSPRKGGTAILAVGAEPSMLNAVMSNGAGETVSGCLVYEGLVVIGTNDEVLPGLAKSWVISDDRRSYTFTLREARFHDGKPLTSEDVRFTLMEVAAKLSPTLAGPVGKSIEGVETPDPRTAVIKLKEPYGPLMRLLTCSLSGGILPAHLYKGTNYRSNPVTMQAPIGTGPFKFERWVRGDNVSFVRNTDYWDPKKPYLDSVVIRFMLNPSSRVQALLAGEVDYVSSSQFPISSVKTIAAAPGFKLERTGWSPNMLWAFFNLERSPLKDVRVRQALLVATDRKYIFDNAFYGLGRPASAPWTVRIPWAADPTIDYDKSHPFDPEKAGQMLEAAGYKAGPNGIRFRLGILYSSAVPERGLAASALQATWKRAGVQVDLEPLENSVLVPRVHRDSNFDVYISSYNSYGDPAIGVASAFLTNTIGMQSGNASLYRSPEIDALFAKAAALTTLEERGAIYRQIQQILMRDLPNITLHENHGFDASTKKLHGAWTAYGFGQWGDAWLDP